MSSKLWTFMVMMELNGQGKSIEIIMIIYIKIWEAVDKFTMIQNYIKMVEIYKSVQSVSEFSYAYNYTPNNSGKIMWGYWKLQMFRKLEYMQYYYNCVIFKM